MAVGSMSRRFCTLVDAPRASNRYQAQNPTMADTKATWGVSTTRRRPAKRSRIGPTGPPRAPAPAHRRPADCRAAAPSPSAARRLDGLLEQRAIAQMNGDAHDMAELGAARGDRGILDRLDLRGERQASR